MDKNIFSWPFIFVFLCRISIGAIIINGAGATFPYPLYSKWFSEYQKVDKTVNFNYQSIGSGGGIRQFLGKTVDFGASDAPMTDEQLKKSNKEILHIPTVLGAVVVTYNVSGFEKSLKLTSEVLADIFLGKIKKWDDKRIRDINPNIKLNGDIIVVHRSDGSGTTNIFTEYLSKVSKEWKEKVGFGTAVNWPVGLGGKGNEGVTGLIKEVNGSIGYVELIYARLNNLPYAEIKNRSGKFVLPSLKSVTEASVGIAIPNDYRTSITDSKNGYPISGFTYLLVWKEMKNSEKGKKIKNFLNWLINDGQNYAEQLHYSRLPSSLIPRLRKTIESIINF